jgi:hypothetical protein
MYGYEAQDGGSYGGLLAQTPFKDLYFPQAAQINAGTSGIISGAGPQAGGQTALAFTNIGDQLGAGGMAGIGMNGSGTAATTSPQLQHSHWSSILDFHNSPAPWILLGILLLYGWIHVSVRAGGKSRFVLS